MSRENEAKHMKEAIRIHTEVTGERPRGWYTGRCSVNTVDLATELGDFDYVADSVADDLPYWLRIGSRDQLVVPYTLDANDMRFATVPGFDCGDPFFTYLRDSFDTLYAEGLAGSPKMFSVGLHCRLIGRPGRVAALRRFIEHARGHAGVWFARRIDIARHWQKRHPPGSAGDRPSCMSREDFVDRFGAVFEHSAWIAERTWDDELGPAHDHAEGLLGAMLRKFRSASDAERLGVLRAHPDLAGKLATEGRLTAGSTREQASAGLDTLDQDERDEFLKLNDAYRTRHGFPFILALGDHLGQDIRAIFRARLENNQDVEFGEACRQVERIAALRLAAILG